VFSRAFATRLITAVALLAAASTSAAAQQTASRDGRVYVSVTDKDGKVLPLAAADVSIKEDGRAREVLKVEKATEPLQIALLVDDSQAATMAINDLRAALSKTIARVLEANPASQIAIITFGERPTLVTDYTNNRGQLERGISRIFARPGAGAYMLEAIVSAAKGVAKREPGRAHLIAIGTEGVEFSNDHYSSVLNQLGESGATLWALTMSAGPRADETEEIRNRGMVLGRGTSQTGGRQEQALANSAVPVVLDRIVDYIFNQYVVTYGRPDTLVPPKKIEVKIAKPGAKVLAPSSAPRVRKQ
jgi:VWFA-related protein